MKQLSKSSAFTATTNDGHKFYGEVVKEIPRQQEPLDDLPSDDLLWASMFQGSWASNVPNARCYAEPLVESPIVLPTIVECAIYGRELK